MTHFLQSDAWANFQQSLGRTVVRDQGDGWSYLAVLEKGKINSRLYCPYGPVLSDPAALSPALESLKQKALDLGATFIRIEPTGEVDQNALPLLGLKRVTHVQPEVTSVVDLSASADDIIVAMSSNNRNLHRTAEAKGLTIQTSDNPVNITVLTRLLREVAAHTGMRAHSDAYISKQAEVLLPTGDATLYCAMYDGKPIVAALAYDGDATRYYAHAAAGYKHRNLNAGTVIVSHMILDAKKKGLTHFDLYGIWPDAPKGSSEAGITRFKRSFGGKDVFYDGTWELPVKPLGYQVYSLLSKLQKARK